MAAILLQPGEVRSRQDRDPWKDTPIPRLAPPTRHRGAYGMGLLREAAFAPAAALPRNDRVDRHLEPPPVRCSSRASRSAVGAFRIRRHPLGCRRL